MPRERPSKRKATFWVNCRQSGSNPGALYEIGSEGTGHADSFLVARQPGASSKTQEARTRSQPLSETASIAGEVVTSAVKGTVNPYSNGEDTDHGTWEKASKLPAATSSVQPSRWRTFSVSTRHSMNGSAWPMRGVWLIHRGCWS